MKNIIFSDFSKDARLPVQLQRAMAKEAEAARDARAKVTFPPSPPPPQTSKQHSEIHI